jgi:hypothetical protein
MSLTKLSLDGNNLLFPFRESLVIDISAGDGKIDNLFLQCMFSIVMNLRVWILKNVHLLYDDELGFQDLFSNKYN